MAKINPTRNSRASFLKTYMEFYKQGRSREELAEELGIEVSSVYSRVQVEKRRGNVMPLIPKQRSDGDSEELKKLLDEFADMASAESGRPKAKAKPASKPEPEEDDDESALEVDEIEALLG